MILATASFITLMEEAAQDLAPWLSSPAHRYESLARGLDRHLHDPVARLATELRLKTKDTDMVLVAGNAPQVYFFANRAMGGLLNCYVPGVLANREWTDRDLATIRRTAPVLVVVPPPPFSPADPVRFKVSRPELFAYIRKHYTELVYHDNGWSLLARRSQGTDYRR
ncbi:MAG: hypothetical protein LDL33_01490 [Desulfomonile sp.]|nr:hypothetical protein [Desulfomonile sp.]